MCPTTKLSALVAQRRAITPHGFRRVPLGVYAPPAAFNPRPSFPYTPPSTDQPKREADCKDKALQHDCGPQPQHISSTPSQLHTHLHSYTSSTEEIKTGLVDPLNVLDTCAHTGPCSNANFAMNNVVVKQTPGRSSAFEQHVSSLQTSPLSLAKTLLERKEREMYPQAPARINSDSHKYHLVVSGNDKLAIFKREMLCELRAGGWRQCIAVLRHMYANGNNGVGFSVSESPSQCHATRETHTRLYTNVHSNTQLDGQGSATDDDYGNIRVKGNGRVKGYDVDDVTPYMKFPDLGDYYLQHSHLKFADLGGPYIREVMRAICPDTHESSKPTLMEIDPITSSTQVLIDMSDASYFDKQLRRYVCDEMLDMCIQAYVIPYYPSHKQCVTLNVHGPYNFALGRAMLRRLLRYSAGMDDVDYSISPINTCPNIRVPVLAWYPDIVIICGKPRDPGTGGMQGAIMRELTRLGMRSNGNDDGWVTVTGKTFRRWLRAGNGFARLHSERISLD
eukprot:CFRG8247T1